MVKQGAPERGEAEPVTAQSHTKEPGVSKSRLAELAEKADKMVEEGRVKIEALERRLKASQDEAQLAALKQKQAMLLEKLQRLLGMDESQLQNKEDSINRTLLYLSEVEIEIDKIRDKQS